jgi:hypothetical protein
VLSGLVLPLLVEPRGDLVARVIHADERIAARAARRVVSRFSWSLRW